MLLELVYGVNGSPNEELAGEINVVTWYPWVKYWTTNFCHVWNLLLSGLSLWTTLKHSTGRGRLLLVMYCDTDHMDFSITKNISPNMSQYSLGDFVIYFFFYDLYCCT